MRWSPLARLADDFPLFGPVILRSLVPSRLIVRKRTWWPLSVTWAMAAFPRVNGVNGVNAAEDDEEDSDEDDDEDVEEEEEEEDEDEEEDDEEDWSPLMQPDGRTPSRTRTTRIEAPRAMNTCLPRRSNTAEETGSTLACPPSPFTPPAPFAHPAPPLSSPAASSVSKGSNACTPPASSPAASSPAASPRCTRSGLPRP